MFTFFRLDFQQATTARFQALPFPSMSVKGRIQKKGAFLECVLGELIAISIIRKVITCIIVLFFYTKEINDPVQKLIV
jgi:hypothetical protein